VACLLVPDLPAVAEARAHPELADRPLVVVSDPGPRASVLSVSPSARRAGIHTGSALAHARSLCAELRVRVASPALERAARDALLDVALSVSPLAELAPPSGGLRAGEAAVHLDASGTSALFRSEAGVAAALETRARMLGLPAVVGVASSRALAHLAAHRAALQDALQNPGTTCVLTPGAEASFLETLPIDWLDPDDALAETLTRFGIHRLGQLLALPRRMLATRLGAGVLDRIDRLRGRGEPPIAAPRATRLREAIDLEAPVDNLEPLAFALQGAFSRLLGRLAVRRLACAEVELGLRLVGGGRDTRQVGLAAPTRDLRVLMRRMRLLLERTPPAAPVEELELQAEGSPDRIDQLDLFRPAGPAPADLDALLAELESLCGPGRVGAPALADDHRPGAFRMTPWQAPPSKIEAPRPPSGARSEPQASGVRQAGPGPARSEPKASGVHQDVPDPATTPSATPPASALLALRALRPPAPAQVQLRAGQPSWVRSAVANGDVVRCAGPWRTSGGWWSEEDRFAFDSFDVATSDGLLVRLRYDRIGHVWHIDAIYD
jgi:protein ImuB